LAFDSRDRAKQLISFGKIPATDIDALIEYRDEGYIIIEVKYEGKEIKTGQRLALERMVNDTAKAGKKSIAIIAGHDIKNSNEDVKLANCKVRKYYHHKQDEWLKLNQTADLADFINWFIKKRIER